MNDTELVKRLSTLLQMDRDAVKLYEEAARVTGRPDLGIGAIDIREQHARHAQHVESAILARGQQPRHPTREFESIMRLHMDSISRAADTDQVMITLRMAERIMNLEYAEILELDMPDDLRRMLQGGLGDEHDHLRAVEEWLDENVGTEVGVYL